MDASLVLALMLETADMSQTLYMTRHPQQYQEMNPILGSHPSQIKVVCYFLTADAGLVVFNHVLPKKYVPVLNYGTVAIEAGFVAHNAHIGVKFSF